MKKIIELSPSFFSDKVNIIYLKLLNLYEKIVKENGENQELFYVVDRFMPSQRELSLVEKNMQIPFNNLKTLIYKFISRHVDIDWILKKYEDVSVYAKNVALVSATSENETNDIKEVISAVDENLTYYKSVDSDSGHNRITDILIDNYLENFEEKNLKIGIMNLASFYCSVFGSNLTSEEISLISREISEEENTLLSSVVQGKKR